MSPPVHPLLSVVLPARNAATTIERAVASIREQSWRDWELIVVDDGSTDGTSGTLARLAREESRMRLVAGTGAGLVAALDAGLALARGAFVARMDADDVSHPGRFAAQVALLRARPEIGLVSCLVEFGGDRVANAGYAKHVEWLNTLVTPEQIALNRFVESPLAHPSVMFRRELVARHGGYRDGDFPEDYELWLRWLDAGVRMAKVPRALLTWHDAPGRLSRTDARYAPEKFFRAKAEWIVKDIVGRGRLTPPAPAEAAFDRRSRATPPYSRRLFVWGAGRPTRKRAAHLEAHGLRIAGYIDVDAKKATTALGGTGAPVVGLDAIPPPTEALVLGYVAARGARELIRGELRRRGFAEGRDFLMCA